MLALVDGFLNRITMYRLMLYYLLGLLVMAGIFGFFGWLPINPANLVFSTVLILAVCWLVNKIFSRTFAAATGSESVYITALILALIISPVAFNNYLGVGFLIYTAAWAMASKYILAIGKKHLFNPAAFGVAIAALTIGQSATWWVAGNYVLLPFVLLGGLLVVRKIRRFDLVLAFAVMALATTIFTTSNANYLIPISQTLFHSTFFFLALVMLIEPLTMPPDRPRRLLYGALVGFLFAPNIHLGSFYFTPELALLIGNLFVYIVSPKGRFMLTLLETNPLAAGVYEFVFAADRPFAFRAGQYLEWTLPHPHPDNRGNRRYFTVASSPTERSVNLGIKFYESPSSFKRALLALKPGGVISASQLAGDFTLPRNSERKLAFIAGGIGITPFRSMVQQMLDTKTPRPAVLLYANKSEAEVAYRDVFDQAQKELGLKTVYVTGPLTMERITQETPDYRERIFYLSGPHGLVASFKESLRAMGIPHWHIKTDFFPGFA